jgi:hypothetical protein
MLKAIIKSPCQFLSVGYLFMICLTVICFGHNLFELRELSRTDYIFDDPVVSDFLLVSTARKHLEKIAA